MGNGGPILLPLVGALVQCVSIILVGYICRSTGYLSASDVHGLSAFVGRLALPAMLFLSMATLDFKSVNHDAPVLLSICAAKAITFFATIATCYFTSSRKEDPSAETFGVRPLLAQNAVAAQGERARQLFDGEPTHDLSGMMWTRCTTHGAQASDPIPTPAVLASGDGPDPAGLAAVMSAESPCHRGQPTRPWMLDAGLYAIFTTQSNDFALGLPLFHAIWGTEYKQLIFLVAPFQFAVLNPLAFALMTFSNMGCAEGKRPICCVMRKVLRSPPMASVILGLLARALLELLKQPLPQVIDSTFDSMSQAFAATALVTLGLSLKPKLEVIKRKSLAVVCLLLAKTLISPLLMRMFVVIYNSVHKLPHENLNFVFLYGMLPSAPTVVVFAREFGGDASLLAALQLIGLLVSFAFLVISTVALQTSLDTKEAGKDLNVITSSLAGVCTLCALYLIASLFARGTSTFRAQPFDVIFCMSAALLTYAGIEVFHPTDTSKRCRDLVGVIAHVAQLWIRLIALLLALLMRAHSKCHDHCCQRAIRWRRWLRFSFLASLVVAIAIEGLGWRLAWLEYGYDSGKCHEAITSTFALYFTVELLLGIGILSCLGSVWIMPTPAILPSSAAIHSALSTPPATPMGRRRRLPHDGNAAAKREDCACHSCWPDVEHCTLNASAATNPGCCARCTDTGGRDCAHCHGDNVNDPAALMSSRLEATNTREGRSRELPTCRLRNRLDTAEVAAARREGEGDMPTHSLQPTDHALPCCPPSPPSSPPSSPGGTVGLLRSQCSPVTHASAQLQHPGTLPVAVSGCSLLMYNPIGGCGGSINGSRNSSINSIRDELECCHCCVAELEMFQFARWRTRLSLFLVIVVLSIMLSITVLVAPRTNASDGIQFELVLLERSAVFGQGLALVAIFGNSPEISGVLLERFRRCFARALTGSSDEAISVFPRVASSFW